ncbi:MAG TPA: AraC family transcriptional regulator [Planctomycetota bacterium]|nr:AraC family transcriptional regulator [Planctomycetota bacterium]
MAEVRCLFAFEHGVAAGAGGGMHRHPCTEIVITRGGAGVLVHGSREFRFTSGDILIYQPDAAHRVDQVRSGRHLCLGLIGCGAGDIAPGVYSSSPHIERLSREVSRALKLNSADRSAKIELLSGLIALELSASTGKAQTLESVAAKVRNRIDADYAKPLTLAKLAASAYVSADYLRQLFRREYGIAPMRYLLSKRIEIARELLGLTQLPIGDIAARCGFNDVFYFSRAFKKIMGMPPRDYRERYSFKPAGATRRKR